MNRNSKKAKDKNMSDIRSPGCKAYKILITEAKNNSLSISPLETKFTSRFTCIRKTLTRDNSYAIIKMQLENLKCQMAYVNSKVESQSRAIERINQDKLYVIGGRILDRLQARKIKEN